MNSHDTDVLIVGGGVIGLACAWYLLQAGRSVRLIERAEIGCGASHGNCGTITPSHAPPLAAPGVPWRALRWMLQEDAPLYIRPRLDAALAHWLWRFSRRCNWRDWWQAARAKAALLNASRHALQALVDEAGLDCEFVASGLVYAHRDGAAFEQQCATQPKLRELGIDVDVWDARRLAAEEPLLRDGVVGGFFFPGDACLRPDRYVAELARIVAAAGAQLETGREVIAIDAAAGAVRLADGSRRAGGHLILATGAWSPRFARDLQLALPIQPGKGYSITYSRPAQAPRRPLVLRERSVCVTAWDSGFRLGSTMEFSGYDERLNRTRLDSLVRAAHEYLQVPEGPERQEEWFGWRPMTWDDLPILGPAPRHPNVLLACGHGMLGVSMSAATGQLIAALVAGSEPPVDPAPYAPQRFA